jgi:hypothetical protein
VRDQAPLGRAEQCRFLRTDSVARPSWVCATQAATHCITKTRTAAALMVSSFGIGHLAVIEGTPLDRALLIRHVDI